VTPSRNGPGQGETGGLEPRTSADFNNGCGALARVSSCGSRSAVAATTPPPPPTSCAGCEHGVFPCFPFLAPDLRREILTVLCNNFAFRNNSGQTVGVANQSLTAFSSLCGGSAARSAMGSRVVSERMLGAARARSVPALQVPPLFSSTVACSSIVRVHVQCLRLSTHVNFLGDLWQSTDVNFLGACACTSGMQRPCTSLPTNSAL